MDELIFDVFLCHATGDENLVQSLAEALQQAGIQPFFDGWHMVPGAPIQESLEQALDQSRCCVVCIGPGSPPPWHNEALRAALETRVTQGQFRVIPVHLPGSCGTGAALPRFLQRLAAVDLSRGLDDGPTFQQLLSGIRGVIPVPPDASAQASPTGSHLEHYLRKAATFRPVEENHHD